MNFYIAFSIHGTNTFIVATTKASGSEELQNREGKFVVVSSRRADYDPATHGIKVEWSRLSTLKGTPLRSPAQVIYMFKRLEKLGWTVDEESRRRFVAKHWSKNKASSVGSTKSKGALPKTGAAASAAAADSNTRISIDDLKGRERDVALYLRGRATWTSPTMIGRTVWGYPHHSASASPVCKRLVEKGVVMRNDCGHYMLVADVLSK